MARQGLRARTARQRETDSDDVKNDTSCVVSCPTRPGTTDTKGAIEQMYRSITQEISRIFLRAIHGVHRQDERRPNPVFSSVAYQAYVRFDQIRTSNSLLHHVVCSHTLAAALSPAVRGPANCRELPSPSPAQTKLGCQPALSFDYLSVALIL